MNFNRMREFIIPIGVLIFMLFLVTPARSVPVSFDWGSFDSTGSTEYGVYDNDNSIVLETGDLVQLVWAGADETVDAPNCDGTPSGDDLLLDSNTINNGLPFPPPQQNKGYVALKTYSFDSMDEIAGGTIYLRAWNSVSVSEATAYGHSDTATLESGGSFKAPRWFTDVDFNGCSEPPTPTATSTEEATPTATNTSTATSTTTSTATNEATATPTSEATATPTETVTQTPTQTATASMTPTLTSTPSPTATDPADAMPTETATATPTEISQPTETPTLTNTPQPTETATSEPATVTPDPPSTEEYLLFLPFVIK